MDYLESMLGCVKGDARTLDYSLPDVVEIRVLVILDWVLPPALCQLENI